jgi:hypothetical protein
MRKRKEDLELAITKLKNKIQKNKREREKNL